MKLERVSIDDIIPADYNPRKDLQPDDPEYQKLKKSVNKFGLADPIVVRYPSMKVIGGHQRLKVLKEKKKKELYMIVLGDVAWIFSEKKITIASDADEKALNVALNKTGGEFDNPKLRDLFLELKELNYDLDITGFELEEREIIIEGFSPREEQQPRLDQRKKVICPECGYDLTND